MGKITKISYPGLLEAYFEEDGENLKFVVTDQNLEITCKDSSQSPNYKLDRFEIGSEIWTIESISNVALAGKCIYLRGSDDCRNKKTIGRTTWIYSAKDRDAYLEKAIALFDLWAHLPKHRDLWFETPDITQLSLF